MAELSDELKQQIELEVRRITSEVDGKREQAVIETLKSQRDFLVGNTKWVVSGFFGLIIVFGALVSFIFGSQFDTKLIDNWISATMSDTISTKVEVFVGRSVEEQTAVLKSNIATAANAAEQDAKKQISESVNQLIRDQIDFGVGEKIDQAKVTLDNLSATEVLARLLPQGAIIAFDRSNGCPDGWSNFQEAAGRMLIGVGQGEIDRIGDNDIPLTDRRYREFGGEERVALTKGEMPAHNHGGNTGTSNSGKFVEWPKERELAGGFSGNSPFSLDDHTHGITSEGQNQAHNNMPPYIALYYCKKN